MSYVPHTDGDRREMLRALGAESVEDLLKEIPGTMRFRGALPLPPPLSQKEIEDEFGELARENRPASEKEAFLGGGVYDHYVPAMVAATVGRPEFYSAYTPYQAEVAQGTLQVIFEFQTLLSRLTGMPVANASLYDGATALVEGVWMASGEKGGRTEALVSSAVSPRYRAVLRTHFAVSGLEIREVPTDGRGGTDLAALEKGVSEKTAVVVGANPNYFGRLEETGEMARIAHARDALFLQIFEPVSLGILKTPGEAGADIAVGEGQALGASLNFGGPLLGLFTCREEFLRRMPGRLSGLTEDADGRRAFTLTLQTREQHIRREKATSNICTNQGLIALAATAYLTALGPRGLERACLLSQERASTLMNLLAGAGAEIPFRGEPFFREFPVRFPRAPLDRGLVEELIGEGIVPGIPLGADYPEMENGWLVAATERRSPETIRRYGDVTARFLAGVREEEHGS